MSPGPKRRSKPDEGGVAVAESRPKLKTPPGYAVLLHNDDYTTMEFVIEVLQKFFQKNHEQALEITLKVHHEGKGIAGIYSRQIAETKVVQVTQHARASEFPLKCTMEPI
ncbi:MAG: ATP-dependent Clp protease adapter ClpS [Bdellovibrionales bacterium]|nr:ATP-dependent Clp protease adapter ClpS [Bdellovibrionales bacterium]